MEQLNIYQNQNPNPKVLACLKFYTDVMRHNYDYYKVESYGSESFGTPASVSIIFYLEITIFKYFKFFKKSEVDFYLNKDCTINQVIKR